MSSERDTELSSFLGEAEELVSGLDETLAGVEPGSPPRQNDINALFRATHTMKGLAGMLDFDHLQSVAHRLEDLLGSIRLGKMGWTDRVYEVVATGVDLIREMVQIIASSGQDALDTSGFMSLVEGCEEGTGASDGRLELDLAEDIRSTFTEYEESRLSATVREGNHLFEITFLVKLAEFATVGKEISDALEAVGEIITKLPAPGGTSGGELKFLYIVGTSDAQFEEALPSIFGDRLLACRKIEARLESTSARPVPAAPEPAPEEPEPAEEAAPTTSRAAASSVRIELDTLESLTSLVGELLADKAHLDEIALALREKSGDEAPYPELVRSIRDIERRVSDLQRRLMTVRLVPFNQIWSRLRRIVQSYTRSSGKRISLDLQGGDTRLDKLIVEKLADPLIHIIRNAIDHGIEPVAEREELGKPAEGRVVVTASPRGSQIVVTVEDDGHGIDWDRVKEKAVERGIIKDPQTATDRELSQAIFQPGFSTAREVTDLSGRGVGLDVVRKNLADVNGFIDIRSRRHEGTEFIITLPITLAIFQSLLIEVEGRVFAIPLSSVLENLRLEASAVQTLEGRDVIQHRGVEIAVVDLGQAFRLRDRMPRSDGYRYFVIVGSAEKRLALTVDAVRGQREIVTKSLGRLLSAVPGIAGGALVGERDLALVVDVAALMATKAA